jgi:hypothetical protein
MSMVTVTNYRLPVVSSYIGIVEVIGSSDSELESDESDDDNEEFVPILESESENRFEEE